MFRPLLQPALYTSTALSLFMAMPVLAQSDAVRAAPQEADEAVNEIVVTARRKEESLQEVPASITVFS